MDWQSLFGQNPLETEDQIKAQLARAQLLRNTLPSDEGQAVGPLRVMSRGAPTAGVIQQGLSDYRERQALDALKVMNEKRRKAIEEEMGRMPTGEQADSGAVAPSATGGATTPLPPSAEALLGDSSLASAYGSGATALPGSVAASQGASPSSMPAPTGAVTPTPTSGQIALPASVRAMSPEEQANAMNRWATRFATLQAPTDSKFNPAAIAAAGIEAAIAEPGKAADRANQLIGQLVVAEANARSKAEDKALDREQRDRFAEQANQYKALGLSLRAQADANSNNFKQLNYDLQREKFEEAKAKGRQSIEERGRAIDSTYGSITNTIDKLINPEGKINPNLKGFVGRADQYKPDLLLTDAERSAGNDLETLQQQMTMLNIADAKKAVGQSFGSFQASEWDRFANLVVSLKRNLPHATLEKNLKELRTIMATKGDVIKRGIEGGMGLYKPEAPVAPGGAPPASLGVGGYDAAKQKRYEDWKKANGIP